MVSRILINIHRPMLTVTREQFYTKCLKKDIPKTVLTDISNSKLAKADIECERLNLKKGVFDYPHGTAYAGTVLYQYRCYSSNPNRGNETKKEPYEEEGKEVDVREDSSAEIDVNKLPENLHEALLIIGMLKRDLNSSVSKYTDLKVLMFVFTLVENYEDEFTKYELYKNIRFKYNFKLVNKMKDFFDKMQEHRRQRWEYYLLHPPTPVIQTLVDDALKEGFTLDEISIAMARVFKLIAVIRHNGYFKGISQNYRFVQSNLDQFNDKTNKVVDFLMKKCNLEDTLFTVKKIDGNHI